MAPVLGKRKRRDQTDDLGENSGLTTDKVKPDRLQALFRQHFESSFEPLEGLASPSDHIKDNETAKGLVGSESDWDGLSEDDEEGKSPVAVQCSTRQSSRADVSKEELKTFMVGVIQVYRLL